MEDIVNVEYLDRLPEDSTIEVNAEIKISLRKIFIKLELYSTNFISTKYFHQKIFLVLQIFLNLNNSLN